MAQGLDAVASERVCVKLTHFYHLYADGDWLEPATEHIEELAISGLIDNLDDMFLGIVGSQENREKVERELPGVSVAWRATGYEQITLNKLKEYADTNDAYILYAHTKGASNQGDLANAWRVSMTHDTITRWQECVTSLKDHHAAGAFWINSTQPEHANHKHFFAGNFWWATSDYIRKLEPVSDRDRYAAEGWIGLGDPKVKIMRPGFSHWGNFWGPYGIR